MSSPGSSTGGRHSPDWWFTVQQVYALRTGEPLPLEGLAPGSAQRVQATFRLRSEYDLGNLWMDVDRPREAEPHFRLGLAGSTSAAERGEFLIRLALAARARGDAAEASAPLTRCLRECPGMASALELRKRLAGGS